MATDHYHQVTAVHGGNRKDREAYIAAMDKTEAAALFDQIKALPKEQLGRSRVLAHTICHLHLRASKPS